MSFLSVILIPLSPEIILMKAHLPSTVQTIPVSSSASNKLVNHTCASAELSSNGIPNNEDTSYHQWVYLLK